MTTINKNPFPGLRPFNEDEEHLFFGRERQVDAMVDTLAATHFLTVVGTSGSGKSSLVNCGLRPALHRGIMAGAGTTWRMAQFRPGNRPIAQMGEALAKALHGDEECAPFTRAEITESTLRMSKLGIIDVFRESRPADHVNLLVVVDQFEELFRFHRIGAAVTDVPAELSDEARAFVELLLEVRNQRDPRMYVVLTMRSDFLGECAQFYGLPEAINEGQYLVPRMTREERRRAIAGPIAVSEAEIDPVLLTRLVNDVGGNPDQLSILQHAVNRTWARWRKDEAGGPLTLKHYEDIGTMARALDQHAEKAYAELQTPREQEICEKLFKALTDKATDARGVRRPTSVETLLLLSGATLEELTHVVDVFRKPSRSFLMPPATETLKPDTIIDISHESLMRVWDRLRGWADDEARSAATLRRLSETAVLHAAEKASLWGGPDLAEAVAWRERVKPDAVWADRYGPGFSDAMQFLEQSAAERNAELTRSADERKKARLTELQHERVVISLIWALLLTVVIGVSLWRHSESKRREAELSAKAATTQMTADHMAINRVLALSRYSLDSTQVDDPRKLQKSLDAATQISAIAATVAPRAHSDVIVKYFRKPSDSEKLSAALKELGFTVEEAANINPRETNCVWYGAKVDEDDVKLVAYAVIRAGLALQGIQPHRNPAYDPRSIHVGHSPNLEDETPYTVDAVKTTPLADLKRHEADARSNVHGTIASLNQKDGSGVINSTDEGLVYFRFSPIPQPLRVGQPVRFMVYYGRKRKYAEGITPEAGQTEAATATDGADAALIAKPKSNL